MFHTTKLQSCNGFERAPETKEKQMLPSRRDLLIGLAASGTITAAPALSHAALSTFEPSAALLEGSPSRGKLDIKIGYSAIAWNDEDMRAIEDLSVLRFPGIQLRANAVKDFPDPHALRDLLAQHHLTFVALSSGTAPVEPAERQSTIETHIKNAKYLRDAGGSYLQIVAASTKGRTFSPADFEYEGKLLTEIAKAVADLGIQTSLHNHMGTMAQTPQGLDAIFDASDPHYVKLELDTAHYLQGGGDPVKAIQQHAKRLLFLHLKDVKDAPTHNGYEFTELGQGRVDFPAIFAALRSANFRGWGIIELDGERLAPIPTPTQSAEISKNYLTTLGIRV
jgi:inosose dehydratase